MMRIDGFSFCMVILSVYLPSPTIAEVSREPGRKPFQIKTWEVFELDLTAKRQYDNPYAAIAPDEKEGLVRVVFTGITGDASGKELTVFGFWDGGQQWKVRFAPPAAGSWEYQTFSDDPGLNHKRGKLGVADWDRNALAENPTRHGLVRVMGSGAQPGRYFQYADGTPFLWIGDTWWNWTKNEIHLSTFKALVDDRAAKGFNVGQLFVPGNGWGRSSSLLDASYDVLDIGHMRKVDSMIAYANSKGITVWIHAWWSREDLDKTAGPEKMKRWWRYLIRRLGSYNVIWVLAGEYNLANYGDLGLNFWKELGKMVKTEDPWGRIVSVHNTPPFWDGGAEAPQWSTAEVLHREPWLDYNQSQVGHGRAANEMIPEVVSEAYAAKPAKPIVVTEAWYEFVEGNPSGKDLRFAAWSAILSGAAGHTYGGGHVWQAHVPESPSGPGGPWPLETGFEKNTLDYEGARSMGHLAQFFREVDWAGMAPHPELVQEYARDKYCLAKPGKEYVLYLRWGGSLKLNLKAFPGEFEYNWFNPATGESLDPKTINGGDLRFFSAPGGYPGTPNFQDWVLHIRKL